jgi:murein DD-endopeptidase / murein LD-carboxypeptidase
MAAREVGINNEGSVLGGSLGRLVSRVSTGFIVLVCVFLAGCSTTPDRSARQDAAVRDALYQQYHQWRGVPYRMGGNSKAGVDCSALVQITYLNAFARQLPRTTDDQAKVGSKVKRGQERSGDLVFFKTGFWRKHVGIYLGNNTFMHASASNGVMVSSLTDPYWNKHYWKSQRP